ncbi:MAG: MFS transporter [Phycisphaeraceae bacterium]|nr:MFS transporter [Phycisphaeraceae bacterium]
MTPRLRHRTLAVPAQRSTILAVVVAALGYFVDIFDLLLFALVRRESLLDVLGPQIAELRAELEVRFAEIVDVAQREAAIDLAVDTFLRNWGAWLDNVLQTTGLLVGGLVWGIIADRRGRLAVLFGSILCYSVANLLNGLITDVDRNGLFGFMHLFGVGTAIGQYEVLRFVAGFGLAGELGAGVTLVAELVSKENRGYATTLIATVGILGAVAGYFVTQVTEWRTAFIIGGVLGLGLLALRVGVVESGMFHQAQQRQVRGRGAFWLLFWPPERLVRYASVVLLAVPIWFVVGTLVKYADLLGGSMGLVGENKPSPGLAVMWCYVGLAGGDLASGLLSQFIRSRRGAILIFHGLTGLAMLAYFTLAPRSVELFYGVVVALGFACGYWAVFVTSAAEQFGTNLRATAATTAPNVVRWSAAGSFLLWHWLEGWIAAMPGRTQAEATWMAAAVGGALVLTIALVALGGIRETFGISLDYEEE